MGINSLKNFVNNTKKFLNINTIIISAYIYLNNKIIILNFHFFNINLINIITIILNYLITILFFQYISRIVEIF